MIPVFQDCIHPQADLCWWLMKDHREAEAVRLSILTSNSKTSQKWIMLNNSKRFQLTLPSSLGPSWLRSCHLCGYTWSCSLFLRNPSHFCYHLTARLAVKTDTNAVKLMRMETGHCWELLQHALLPLQKSDEQQTPRTTSRRSTRNGVFPLNFSKVEWHCRREMVKAWWLL